MAKRIRISYGSDIAIMEWDAAQASASISVNGRTTQYQTADARHRTGNAVRLVCGLLWGTLYETEEEARAAGEDPATDTVCIWEDVEYWPAPDDEAFGAYA